MANGEKTSEDKVAANISKLLKLCEITDKLIDESEAVIRLPQKDLFRVDEVAIYFGVSRSVIYLWIDHGHLNAEKLNGTLRIPRESILKFRIKSIIDKLT